MQVISCLKHQVRDLLGVWSSLSALVVCVQAAYLLHSLKSLHSLWKPFLYTFPCWSLSAELLNYETFEALGGKKSQHIKTHSITLQYLGRHQAIPVDHSLPSFRKPVTHIKILCKAFTIIILQKQALIPQINAFLSLENPYTNTVLLYTVSRQQWSTSALLSTISLNYRELQRNPKQITPNILFFVAIYI